MAGDITQRHHPFTRNVPGIAVRKKNTSSRQLIDGQCASLVGSDVEVQELSDSTARRRRMMTFRLAMRRMPMASAIQSARPASLQG